MYSPTEIKSLRIELANAMKSKDIVKTLLSPPTSVSSNISLLHCAARNNILIERFLSTMLSILFRDKNRDTFFKIINNDSLGFDTLRSFWRISSFFRDNDAELTLAYLLHEYRKSDPNSMIRMKWYNLIFGQSYREKNWEFILNWSKVATDAEFNSINNRNLYGVLIGLINGNFIEEANFLLSRKKPSMTALDELFFLIPNFRLGNITEIPTQLSLIRQLHKALPDRGKEWDWLCQTYSEKISNLTYNFLDVRTNDQKAEQLRQLILNALIQKQPLAFQRIGDGESYKCNLPLIATNYTDNLKDDDLARELAWWNRNIDQSTGEQFATLFRESLINADIIGIISAYRLIRDASQEPLANSITGRALLSHVEALDTLIPLKNKIITEDRAHTILYTRPFIKELIENAKNIVVVGGLSLKDMGLKTDKTTSFIALTPEQNKGLPTPANARSIVDEFKSIATDLSTLCQPGTLAFISGGYVGKALVDVAKRSGAVALDIGSLADLLSGHHTRSPADAI